MGVAFKEMYGTPQPEVSKARKKGLLAAELRSFICVSLFFVAVTLTRDPFLGYSLQRNVWHSPA